MPNIFLILLLSKGILRGQGKDLSLAIKKMLTNARRHEITQTV
jgi:hypothetical protein